MRYQYKYRTTTWEYWQLSMYYIYGSMVGVCNAIFTVAMIALIATRWQVSGDFFRGLMVLGCLMFPVIQPVAIYRRAKRQADANQQEIQLGFDSAGIHISVGEKQSLVKWNDVKRVSKKPTMIIVFSDKAHGFVLTNRILGNEKESFYAYVTSRMHQ